MALMSLSLMMAHRFYSNYSTQPSLAAVIFKDYGGRVAMQMSWVWQNVHAPYLILLKSMDYSSCLMKRGHSLLLGYPSYILKQLSRHQHWRHGHFVQTPPDDRYLTFLL